MGWETGIVVRKTPTYSGSTCWQDEEAGNFKIDSDRADFHDQDLANAITSTLNVNGENGMNANLAMGDNLITGLADGIADNDAATVLQVNAAYEMPAVASDGDLVEYNAGSWIVSKPFFSFDNGGWVGGAGDDTGISMYSFGSTIAVLTASRKSDTLDLVDLSIQADTISISSSNGKNINLLSDNDLVLDNLLTVKGETRIQMGNADDANAFVKIQAPSDVGGVDTLNITDPAGDELFTIDSLDRCVIQAIPNNNGSTGSSANMNIDGNGLIQVVSSSVRYKDHIEDLQYGLEDVMKMRPVTFTDKGSDERYAGFTAEDIDALGMTELVTYKDDRPEALSYDRFTAVLVNAVQELTARVKELESSPS